MTLKRLNIVLLLLGVGSLVWMVQSVGPAKLWNDFGTLGWGVAVVVLLEATGDLFHTQAWRCALAAAGRHEDFWSLTWKRLAGYGVNYFTPTATLGGEVARIALTADSGGGAQSTGAVLIDKVCMAMTHLMLATMGALVLLHTHLAPAAIAPMLLAAGALAAGIVFFLHLQRQGRAGAFIRRLARNRPRWQAFAAQASAMDETLSLFYRERKGDFARVMMWHMAGFAMGFLQTAWFLFQLNRHAGLSTVAGLWVFGLWFDLLAFAVPMGLGTLEGSRILAFVVFGYRAIEGMTFGIALRVGQAVLAVAGLGAYFVLTVKLEHHKHAFREP
jgi:hypothetical protein